ncbi:MAG: restriction endonuclease subunit S, partial [Bacteroidales bacterium]|nr:restriction endonuclease subunit S [Candidatus Colimorpha merdihippi]
MNEWKTKRLKELLSFEKKGITPAYTEKGNNAILVLNQKCNRDFSIRFDAAQYHDTNKKGVPASLLLRKGDILINSTGKGTLGRVAQFEGSPYPTTIDSHMLLLRPADEIDALYLGYALKQFQAVLMTKGIGSSGQEELDKLSLNDIKISFPGDINQQRHIARSLHLLDIKIELNRQLNDNL